MNQGNKGPSDRGTEAIARACGADNWRLAVAIVAIVNVAMIAPSCRKEASSAKNLAVVVLGGEKFTLELKLTDAERAEGMMGRESIGRNEGMLFAFPFAKVQRFWMKNCKVDLDIIYLDGGGRIVKIMTMDAPEPGTPENDLPGYSSTYPAQFAIEIAAGRAAELGLEAGQKIELDLESLKTAAK